MGKSGLEDLFAGDSEVAAMLRSQFDSIDATTRSQYVPAIETWSFHLKNAFGILLNASCPMFLVWDSDTTQGVSGERLLFYNDAYLTLLKETQQFVPCGRSVSESWTQDWSRVRSDVEHVFTIGKPLRREQEPFPIHQGSNAKKHYYTWSYNPLWNETDQVIGVFATGYPVSCETIETEASASPQGNQERFCSHETQQPRFEDTTLQRTEAALRESEARFQAFMSHSPTAAWIADQDGRLLYLSPTYAQLFLVPGQDGVGKQIHDIFTEEFTQQFLENNRRVFETGQVIETIETAPRPDGSIGSFLVYKFPMPQTSGAMLLGGVAIDMTERNRTEEVLRRREEELSLITNALPVLIAYVDKDHYYRFNNQPYEDWLGQSTASLAGKHLREALGEPVYKTVRPYIEQALAGNRVSFESQLSYRNGETHYVSASYIPHRNSQGEVEGFFSLVSDIGDRKQAEAERERLLQELASERARFEAVLRQMPEGVIIADAASETLLLANERTKQMLQHSFELNLELEAYDQKIPFQAYHPNGQPYTTDDYPLVRSLRTGEVVTHEEMEICYADSNRIVIDTNSSPIFDNRGEITSAVVMMQDITERKQAEEALRQSEERLRLTMEGAQMGTWDMDLLTGKAIWSEQHFTMLGYEPVATGEATEEMWYSRIHADDLEQVSQEWQQSRLEHRVYRTEYRVIRADTEQIAWLAALGNFTYDQTDQAIRSIGVLFDISDRKHAELALRQSEEQLRLAQRAAGAGLWDWDIVNNQVTWSDEYYRLYGLDKTTVASYENWLASIVEADRARVDKTARDALEQRTNLNVEFRILHPTEEERWLTAIGQTFYDQHGQPKRMTGIALDITKRKQAEKALERYQLLSEHSRDIVLYFRSNGQILEANQAAVQTYGYDRAELLTLTVADLRAPDTLSIMPEQFEQAIQQGILFETVHRCKNGTDFPVEVSAQSAVIGDETVLLSVIRNITERKRAELDREQLLVREQAAREAAEAAEQRAHFLAESSTTLTSSLDYEYTLSSVAQAVVPTLADWCAIDILNDDGTLERLATTHIDPAKVQWGKELHHRYPPDLNAPQGLAQVLRTGQAEYYPTVTDEQIVAAARDDEHLRILREIGFSSAMLVPLNARGKTLGAISFVAAESGRSYSSDDLSLAEELACRAAIALDNARLYKEAQQAQQAAERAADRTARLQAVTAALSESLTPEQVAEVIVEQSMDVLKASAVLVVLVSQDRKELEIVKSVGYIEDLVETWRRFSIDTDVPLAEAIRTGEPAWFETILERIARYPHLVEIYRRYDFEAWIALPLIVEGKAVGGMLLSFKEYQHLHQDDRDFVLALTQQCAQAIVRAQLYEAEQQARAEAERANRIKDEFLAVLSHELRSPLNPILGWSKLLRNGNLDATRTAYALETIERNAQLQVQLIDDLLDLSRILSGKLALNVTLVDLSFIISAALETVQLAAEAKSLHIQTITAPTIGKVNGDAGRLQQVVWNLMSNAVKFTPAGGHITLELASVGTHAQIRVQDTGKGINPEFLPYVFEYFRQEDGTTTRKFGGLGLGLAIVRQIVELHGGTVTATSLGEGQGATFTVLIPLADEPMSLPTLNQASDITLNLNGIRILVVDDDADSRDFIAFVLKQAKASVSSVASGLEALQQLQQSKPDIIVSDIGMPGMDGYMLMQHIRTLDQARTVPAIALTAYAGEINQKQALAAGFQHHMSKPVEPDKLVTTIATLINSQP